MYENRKSAVSELAKISPRKMEFGPHTAVIFLIAEELKPSAYPLKLSSTIPLFWVTVSPILKACTFAKYLLVSCTSDSVKADNLLKSTRPMATVIMPGSLMLSNLPSPGMFLFSARAPVLSVPKSVQLPSKDP